MKPLSPQDLKVGDIFFECQHGINLYFKTLTQPEVVEVDFVDSIRKQWSWTSQTLSGKEVAHVLTEGLEHYGPRIYSAPQYTYLTKEGKFKYKIS